MFSFKSVDAVIPLQSYKLVCRHLHYGVTEESLDLSLRSIISYLEEKKSLIHTSDVMSIFIAIFEAGAKATDKSLDLAIQVNSLNEICGPFILQQIIRKGAKPSDKSLELAKASGDEKIIAAVTKHIAAMAEREAAPRPDKS